MHGITNCYSTRECEVTHALTISAVTNDDGTFKAWVVSHDGVIAEFPRCEITIRAMQNNTSEKQELYTITIPDDKTSL